MAAQQVVEHSPGPWAFHGPRSNIHVCEAKRPHMRVCFLTSDGPTTDNARLIAAAPDLLKALLEIQEICTNKFGGADEHGALNDIFRTVNFATHELRKGT